jgi:DNA-binding MurR/RpiR family transcriptional regulator
MNQTAAAQELGIAQSSVQRRLKSAGYYDYYNARELIAQTLDNRDEQNS